MRLKDLSCGYESPCEPCITLLAVIMRTYTSVLRGAPSVKDSFTYKMLKMGTVIHK